MTPISFGSVSMPAMQYAIVTDILLAIPCCIAFSSIFISKEHANKISIALFWISTMVALFISRAPLIFMNNVSNIDESVFTVRAKMALENPIPWTHYDPTTSGPLDTLALLLAPMLHLNISYTTTRCIALLFVFVMLFLFSEIISKCHTDRAARIAVLMPLCFFVQATFFDIVAYTSELVSMLLILINVNSFAKYRENFKNINLFFCNLALGAIPFAKLQAVPIAVFLFFVELLFVWKHKINLNFKFFFSLLFGILAIPLAIMFPVILSGGFHDFLVSYLLQPSQYMEKANFSLAFLTSYVPEFSMFFISSTLSAYLLFAIFAYNGYKQKRVDINFVLFFYVGLFLASIFATYSPGRYYSHYLLFLIFPISLLISESALLITNRNNTNNLFSKYGAMMIVTAIVIVPLFLFRVSNPEVHFRQFAMPEISRNPSDVALIKKDIEPRSKILVWGFMPDIYIISDSMPVSHDAMTQFEIVHGKYRPYFQNRLLQDIAKKNPDYVVEAVFKDAFNFKDEKAEGIGSFTKLKIILDRRYAMIGSNGRLHIFKRLKIE